MGSKIAKIGLSLVTVMMMSACGTDDIVEAVADAIGADITKGTIGTSVVSNDSAIATLNKPYVLIIKNASETKVTNATSLYTLVGLDVIRVNSSFGCATLGLTQKSTEELEGGYTYTTYESGGKSCDEFDYANSDSSSKGTTNVALSYSQEDMNK